MEIFIHLLNYLKRGVHSLLVCLLLSSMAMAQQAERVEGTVTDQAGQTMPGVSIRIKGSTSSTHTNGSGNYSILSHSADDKLVFSFLGYQTLEVAIANRSSVDVVLVEEAHSLNEVVVTALGIEREKKTLAYATQQISSKDINDAPASNFISGLSGKIAGVNIVSGGAIGSSARITLRGESSLSMQNNQPLFVIDGTPVANDPTVNNSADYGNSAAAINPADIESVNVLKGPAASALYGSRAANGAIVITTKKGNKGGVGVDFNSYYFVGKVGRLPKFQNEFGAGRNGEYKGSNFGASWSAYPDGLQDGYDESWGPRLDVGTLHAQFDSPTTNGFRGADVSLNNRGDIIATPWVSQPDNIKDFFQTGRKIYNNLAFSGSSDKGHYRLSMTALNETGTIPNNNLDRYQASISTGYMLSKKLSSNINLTYANTQSSNRPDNGYGRNTVMYFFTWMNRNVNTNSLKEYWQKGLEGTRQFQYNYGENHNNPFFLMYENTKGQNKNHVFGNVDLTYILNEHLDIKVRTALDYYNDERPTRTSYSEISSPKGRYEIQRLGYMERNSDFLLTYKKLFTGDDLELTLSGGANQFDLSHSSNVAGIPELLIPGIYNLSNTSAQSYVSSSEMKKRINSVYALANFGYKDLFHLDLTARNDWSSTLPQNNNSYFYPSVGLNTNLKKLLAIPNFANQAQVRLSWARVGNDAAPYQLINAYVNQQKWGDQPALSGSSSLANANLKPEIISTYELGTAWSFLSNRLAFDVTYYDIRSKNQIVALPLVSSSGFASRAINAGEIRNTGFEVMLSGTPVSHYSSLRWDVSLNWAKNFGKVISLTDEVDKLVQAAPGEEASIQARAGERMGAIWGPGFERVPDGPLKGKIIITPNGNAKATSEDINLGNINPDWTAGLSNRVSFKNFSLYALVGGQVGGKFISRFYNKAVGAGQLAESAEGRSARPVGQEYLDPYFIPGAAQMPDGSYQPNNTSTDGTFSSGVYGTDIRYFYKGRMDHITEAQLFSATYFKLRELTVGYTLPQKLIAGTFIQKATLNLTGRNLFLITPSSNRHFDPEVSVATAGNGLIPGFENMSLPSSRELGVSLHVSF
ncbi:SusC/RagA family TonB-linked outer membrane protein [Pontibacter sp. 13R65]|uniref:SusC/RagA family TonB-linked outer membrane protein n=1 Tax=Pontibacter sp. 13R65 TaxID=3127458 RepID=UPI00301CF7E8